MLNKLIYFIKYSALVFYFSIISINVNAQSATGLNFDGVDDFIDCGNDSSVSNLGKNGFTLEAWINFVDVSKVNSIIRKTGDYNLYIASGTLYIETWPGGLGDPAWQIFHGTTLVPNNAWTHVAATWDGTTLAFFVNGNVDAGSMQTGSVNGAENLYIGYSSIYNQPLDGSLDEVRIWNRPLCQAEIQQNMNCALSPSGQIGLVGLYHLDQGIVGANNSNDTTLIDSSGNSNNGMLTNFNLSGSISNWANGTITENCIEYVPTLAGSPGIEAVCNNYLLLSPFTYYQDTTCNLICAISPSGPFPLTGTLTACVKIEDSVQVYNEVPYVQRHYDIEPDANAATSTGTVTLYFTQMEFNNYNAARGLYLPLPTNSTDVTGIASLRVNQFHGTGTSPDNYTGANETIDPADNQVAWNAGKSRWEVTFDVSGFSGFYLTSSLGVLATDFTSFTGNLQSAKTVKLEWRIENQASVKQYNVERSRDGNKFVTIGSVNLSSQNTYTFYDEKHLPGHNFYRIQILVNEQYKYSSIIKINSADINSNTLLYPNPAKDFVVWQSTDHSLINSEAYLRDIQGRLLKKIIITKIPMQIDISSLSTGTYFLKTGNAGIFRIIKL